ncbi:MAG TPA: RnfABCDGE type electron transport complex subunit G [Thermodesulforhabdus norvegica]|uniref:Ion-translocating oxidoreductase complex subunit G n=1 Tax=Thermodesulforhabdus norvegica TaxID=39841 RepID=A0A7C0WS88_9BACT|nr:RnfABCDGE type electron transport complex subunit G [Deltaproteobacteria bacterium]MBW2069429.1 RnfABCDGE type electron transport complex subunit G [Deltaproteobacteria bacterium]HDL90084.1 RnfABCDGE type electron transport complex subunit G [Thermodesulforhabdus norvegica]
MRDMIKMVVVLTAITAVSSLALSYINDATRAAREYQLLKYVKEPSIKAVFAKLDYNNDPIKDRITLKLGKEGKTIFPAKKDGHIIAVAYDAAAAGYHGEIEVMVGIKPDGTLAGIGIMRHSETPGLGARVAEPSFTEQFRNAKPPVKLSSEGGTINGISGATISSKGVITAVNEALKLFPEVKKEVFKP